MEKEIEKEKEGRPAPYRIRLAVEVYSGSACTLEAAVTPPDEENSDKKYGARQLVRECQHFPHMRWLGEHSIRRMIRMYGDLDSDGLALLGDDYRPILWARITSEELGITDAVLLRDERPEK